MEQKKVQSDFFFQFERKTNDFYLKLIFIIFFECIIDKHPVLFLFTSQSNGTKSEIKLFVYDIQKKMF